MVHVLGMSVLYCSCTLLCHIIVLHNYSVMCVEVTLKLHQYINSINPLSIVLYLYFRLPLMDMCVCANICIYMICIITPLEVSGSFQLRDWYHL